MSDLQRTDLTVRAERALLAGLITPDSLADLRNPLAELSSLAATAGAIVVGGLIQKRMRLDNRTALGKGKALELKELADQLEADVIIVDNDLSPRQIRELERVTERRVIDRSELILAIFASRARTHEARLQVELAQLQYTAPRLRGMWTHLERIAGAAGAGGAGVVGGIGTRGPGERQIEIDRRLVADRLSHLKAKLAEIDGRKVRQVRSRKDAFTVSLVGYTNAGKSTLMNALTNAGQLVADKLFATLDTKTVRWSLESGKTVLLSDTVGFVRDLPHHLVASFRATLEEALHADLLLHVVDVSSPTAIQQVEAVRRVLEELDCLDRPTVLVLNKIDAAEDVSICNVLENRHTAHVRISARTGQGVDQLVRKVTQAVDEAAVEVTIHADAADGKLIAAIERTALVHHREYADGRVEMKIRVSRAQLDQLRGRFPTLIVPQGNGEDAAAR